MNSSISIKQMYDLSIKTTIDSLHCFLELKLNPKEYFYPWLSFSSDSEYHKDDGFTEEEFEKIKNESVKKWNMFQSEKYRKLFKEKLTENLTNFLRKIEAETEVHFEEGKSLYQKVSKNEDIIFKLLEKKGPGIFLYDSILEIILGWCHEKDLKQIEKLTMALKAYAKSTFDSTPVSYLEKKYKVARLYPHVLSEIRKLKKDITLYKKKFRTYQELEKEIISKWREKEITIENIQWFTRLQKIAKKEEEKTGIDMVPFIVSHSPKELTEMIFSDLFYKSVSTIDKIVRNKEEILKIMSLSLENVGHGIWWHLHLS